MNTVAGTTANYSLTNCNGGSSPCRPAWNEAGNADDNFRIGYTSTPVQMASAACDPFVLAMYQTLWGFT